MKILLVDDHALLREGLALLLAQTAPRLNCLQAGSLAQAEHLAATEPGIELVLLDLDLPDCQDLAGLRSLRQRLPLARLVVISAQEDPRRVADCIAQGALAFIHKSAPFARLSAALSQVVHGEIELEPLVIAAMPRPQPALAAGLSERQQEVLQLLLRGASNKEIERALGLSASTVKTHLAALFQRLGASNRTQAVMLAAAKGVKPAAGLNRAAGAAG